MPSTYSSRLRLEKQATGENDNTWGDLFDTLVDMIDAAIAGRAAVTHDDSASYTLTTANGTSDEARNMILDIGGTLTAARNVVVPTASKLYVVKNATSGGYAVTVKTSGGTGISVPNGKTMLVYCDGTNVVDGVNCLTTLTVGGNVVLGDNASDTLRMTNDVFQNTGAKNLGFNTAPHGSWTSAAYSLEMGGPGYGIYTQVDTTRLVANVVQESGSYKYARSDYAHLLALESGQFGLSGAASGTAGNPITFATGISVALSNIATGASGTATVLTVNKDAITGRSTNAAGTGNYSGADAVEYERKSSDCGIVSKGQIVGFDENGEVTDLWARSKSFGTKSTNPGIVLGDAWSTEEALGMKKPSAPIQPEAGGEADTAEARIEHLAQMAEYELALDRFNALLEAARQRVDRIAYCGKVPVNVIGAAVGDYIIPVQDGDGIMGVPIAAPTFDQYRIAVGQVRKILPDGRALIAVKVG